MEKEELTEVREKLILLRSTCLSKEFDADGAVILSHAIRWLHFKIEGKPFEPPTD